MRIFSSFFVMEYKRVLLNRKIIVLFLFLSVLVLYFFQIGIQNYKSIIGNKDKFLEFEKLKVKQYLNYSQYGGYGFRILYIPSPLSIYFSNSSTITNLSARVDSGDRLHIYNSFKGKTLFEGKSGGFKDFSGILLLLGSLLVLYLGNEAMRYKDYLRFIIGFIDYRCLFFLIVSVRMLIIILFFLFNTVVSLLFLKLNQIELNQTEYRNLFIYLGLLVLLIMLFYILGVITGAMKSRLAGMMLIIIFWFISVFLIPGIVNLVISQKSEDIISNYQLEWVKLNRIMDFEKKVLENIGPSRLYLEKEEKANNVLKGYLDNILPELIGFEKKMENDLIKNIRLYQRFSIFYPSSFYLNVGNEISSKGYKNFILFFKYLQKLKQQFVRFYMNKRYFGRSSTGGKGGNNEKRVNSKSGFEKKNIESFVKKDENLFYAKSLLPDGFIYGVLITFLFIIFLTFISYILFKRSLKLL